MTTRAGRPLRFLGATMAGWATLRIVLLWPHSAPIAAAIDAIVPHRAAATPFARALVVPVPTPAARMTAATGKLPSAPPAVDEARKQRLIALALAGMIRFGDPEAPPGQTLAPAAIPPPTRPTAAGPLPSRWSIDGWLLLRDSGRHASGFGGGQLGGAQAGVRVAYTLDRRHRLAAFARADTPLRGGGQEAAIGLDWQPTRLPVRVIAEERLDLGTGKAAPAAGVVGGFGPSMIQGFRIEGYGQAGIVGRGDGQGFVDGDARVTRPIGKVAGLAVDIGAGTWGGAQPDASRLDIGPTIGVALPIAGQTVRLAVDWRQRIAGHAAPGSGPALTLGAHF